MNDTNAFEYVAPQQREDAKSSEETELERFADSLKSLRFTHPKDFIVETEEQLNALRDVRGKEAANV